MKKLLLTLIALVVLGIGAYVWANRISEDDLPEMLSGDYELVRWELSSNGEPMDSLVIHRLPLKSEILHMSYSAEGEVSLATEMDFITTYAISSYKWELCDKLRNGWLFPYYSVEQWFQATTSDGGYTLVSLSSYCNRFCFTEEFVSLVIRLTDPANEHIKWELIFHKK